MKLLRMIKRERYNVIDVGVLIVAIQNLPDSPLVACAIWIGASLSLNAVAGAILNARAGRSE